MSDEAAFEDEQRSIIEALLDRPLAARAQVVSPSAASGEAQLLRIHDASLMVHDKVRSLSNCRIRTRRSWSFAPNDIPVRDTINHVYATNAGAQRQGLRHSRERDG